MHACVRCLDTSDSSLRNANLGLYSGCKGEEGAPSKAGYGLFMTV
jgi:hypothetical protein